VRGKGFTGGFVAALVAGTVLPVGASAADQRVEVGDYFFAPREITLEPGDTVTWQFVGTEPHTSTSHAGQAESWDSPLLERSDVPNTFSHTFTQRGRFTYYCKPHPFMTAAVQVGAPPVMTPSPVTTMPVFPGPADTTAPSVNRLRARPSRFCTRRTRRCRRRGTKLSFRLSEDAAVTVRIAAAGRPRTTLRLIRRRMRAGTVRIRLTGHGLRPRRYRVTLVAADAAGNRSKPVSTHVEVRPS
jgi:plastocyanin